MSVIVLLLHAGLTRRVSYWLVRE